MSVVRVSVGNIAPRIRNPITGETSFFGLLNRKAYENKGQHLLTALGGAAEMTAQGKALLEERFGAVFEEGMDARFQIEAVNLEAVLALFERCDPGFAETDATREIREELATKELAIQKSPVLTPEEVASVSAVFVATARQATTVGQGTSARGEGMENRRLFNLFELSVPSEIIATMKNSLAIRFLSAEEVATTQGGASKGKTSDGWTIGDNIIWTQE